MDEELSSIRGGGTWLLVADPGMGKSVAGFKMLRNHLNEGKKGLILSHEILEKASSLKDAVDLTIRRLCPNLAYFSFATDLNLGGLDEFLFILEDINRSKSPANLCEKVLGWSNNPNDEARSTSPSWTIIASIWPDIYSILGKNIREKTNQRLLIANGFSIENAKAAIIQRAVLEGISLSDTQARNLAEELGSDPLLISLYSWSREGLAENVVEDYIGDVALRISHSTSGTSSYGVLEALRSLGVLILLNRLGDVTWREVTQAKEISSNHLRELSLIADEGQLMRQVGNPAKPRLVFRHERVRNAILADALIECLPLSPDVVADPFYAEIVGEAISRNDCPPQLLDLAISKNPLSIFCAFRRSSPIAQEKLAELILDWTGQINETAPSSQGLFWEASRQLARTTHRLVPKLVSSFRSDPHQRDIALFLNGNVMGGISLLEWNPPERRSKWRDDVIEHALLHHRDQLITDLSQILENDKLMIGREVGILNLAGYLKDSSFNPLIRKRWTADPKKLESLASYIWAAAQSHIGGGDSPLKDIVDFWIRAVEDEKNKDFLEQKVDWDSLKFAFGNEPPPDSAILKLIGSVKITIPSGQFTTVYLT